MKNKVAKLNKKQKDQRQKHVVFTINAIQFARYSYPIGKRLEEQGYKVTYITYCKECVEFFNKRRASYEYIIDGMAQCKLEKPLVEYLEAFEEKYEVPSMNLLLFGDRNHAWFSEEKAKESLVRHFMYWGKFLSENNVDFILGGTERFINEVPRAVSRRFKTRHLVCKVPPIKGNFVISEDHMGRWTTLNDYWKEHKNKPLTAAERKQAAAFIDDLINTKKRSYLCFGKNTITWQDVMYFFDRLYVNLFTEKRKNPYANLFHIAWEHLQKVIRKRFVWVLYKKPKEGERYIFYPLHLQNDAQIIVRAPQYSDQVALIETLSHFVPAGYYLYVKEHPNNVGGMPLDALWRIKRLPNVRLLSVNTHSHTLIEGADLIITVNSTVGWEGLIYQKPVITLGTAFYDISGLTYNVRDFYQLAETIKKGIKDSKQNGKNKNKKLTERRELLYRFVHAVLKNIHEGTIVMQGEYWDKYMQDENLEKVTQGIIEELERY